MPTQANDWPSADELEAWARQPIAEIQAAEQRVYGRVLSKGLEYRLNSWASGIEDGRVPIFNLYTGAADAVESVDTVVLVAGQKANDELYFALKGSVENLHRIGDCLAPRKLDHAIYEGELAGRELWSPEERYIYEGELERWEEATVGATA